MAEKFPSYSIISAYLLLQSCEVCFFLVLFFLLLLYLLPHTTLWNGG